MTREVGKSQIVPFSRLGAANIRWWNFCPCALCESTTLVWRNIFYDHEWSILHSLKRVSTSFASFTLREQKENQTPWIGSEPSTSRYLSEWVKNEREIKKERLFRIGYADHCNTMALLPLLARTGRKILCKDSCESGPWRERQRSHERVSSKTIAGRGKVIENQHDASKWFDKEWINKEKLC